MNIFKRFLISFIFEWNQITLGCNWYTLTFAQVEFEYDKMMQGLELTVIFIGFGIRIRYNLPESDKIFEKYEKEIKKIKDQVS